MSSDPIGKFGNGWTMLDNVVYLDWKRLGLTKEAPHRCLSWNRLPRKESPDSMTDLRVLAESPEPTSLPEKVSLLKNLARLEFPRKFVKTLQLGMIPRSVRSVRISKPGTATWPASVPMPSVTALDSGDGFLKFGKSQFPNLTNLTLKIGPRNRTTGHNFGVRSDNRARLLYSQLAGNSLPGLWGLPLRYFGIYTETFRSFDHSRQRSNSVKCT